LFRERKENPKSLTEWHNDDELVRSDFGLRWQAQRDTALGPHKQRRHGAPAAAIQKRSLAVSDRATQMNFSITTLPPEQIPELLNLIRELARFEQLEHEVETTADSLRNSLFGSQAVAGALVAHHSGEMIGYAVYFFTFSTFVGRPGIWLEDLYVRPEFRRQGVGRALIGAVARVGAERNCGRFEWTALNWNEKALNFYQKLGARVMDDWRVFRLTSTGLRKLASSSPPVGDA
jgi:GNAT superfamily N-acetyltransferase